MTTDTAVRVTRLIVKDKIPVEEIPYIDNPELRVDEHESTEMPFRYVKDKEGKPIMPEVSCCQLCEGFEEVDLLISYLGDGGIDSEGLGEGIRRYVVSVPLQNFSIKSLKITVLGEKELLNGKVRSFKSSYRLGFRNEIV